MTQNNAGDNLFKHTFLEILEKRSCFPCTTSSLPWATQQDGGMLIKFVFCSTEPTTLCFNMSPALYIYHWQCLSRVLSHPHLSALEPHGLELKSLRCSQRWLLPNAVWWWLPRCASPLKGNWWSCSIPRSMLGSSFLPKIFPGHTCTSKCCGLMASRQCCSEASSLAFRPSCPDSEAWGWCCTYSLLFYYFKCMFWSLWTFQAVSLHALMIRVDGRGIWRK